MMHIGSAASRHGSTRVPVRSLYQAGKPFLATGPACPRPFHGAVPVAGAFGLSPSRAPPGLAIATAVALSAKRSVRNAMFRRVVPARSRRMYLARGESDDARVRDRSTFASVPRSIRDKVPPWSTTWFDLPTSWGRLEDPRRADIAMDGCDRLHAFLRDRAPPHRIRASHGQPDHRSN